MFDPQLDAQNQPTFDAKDYKAEDDEADDADDDAATTWPNLTLFSERSIKMTTCSRHAYSPQKTDYTKNLVICVYGTMFVRHTHRLGNLT